MIEEKPIVRIRQLSDEIDRDPQCGNVRIRIDAGLRIASSVGPDGSRHFAIRPEEKVPDCYLWYSLPGKTAKAREIAAFNPRGLFDADVLYTEFDLNRPTVWRITPVFERDFSEWPAIETAMDQATYDEILDALALGQLEPLTNDISAIGCKWRGYIKRRRINQFSATEPVTYRWIGSLEKIEAAKVPE